MIGVQWIGWDGSVWDLRTGQVKMTKAGVTGLGHLSYDAYTRETALSDGQRFTGWRANPRSILLPVLIGQTATEDEWMALDSAWWKTMRPDKPGTLIVVAPDGSSRSIRLRFVDDGNMAFDHDPTKDRLSVAVLNMIADDPWWVGPAFTRSFWGGSAPEDFFGGGSHVGPPFHIGAASTLGDAVLNNPGDIDTWPVYYIDGPATTFAVTINGAPISGTTPVLVDTQLRIETSPTRQVATLVTGGTVNTDGVRVGGVETNVTRLLAEVSFAPIKSQVDVDLHVSLTGTGRVTLAGVPRFFRAWG